jgi:hypothetical protein
LLRGSQLDRSTLRQKFEQLHQAWPWSGLARFGPTSPKRPPEMPLTLWRLDQSSCRRILLTAERVSPSDRERVRSYIVGSHCYVGIGSTRLRQRIAGDLNDLAEQLAPSATSPTLTRIGDSHRKL